MRLAAAAAATKARSRNRSCADDTRVADKLFSRAGSGESAYAAAAVIVSAATTSQMRSRAAMRSSSKPAPKLPTMKAADPQSRTGP
jgi:hypothetical protein